MVGRWGAGALSGALGSLCFPSSQTGVETSLLAQNQNRGKKPLMSSVPFTSLKKRCRDFQQIYILPDVSGLIKPPPLGSGQQASKGIEADRLGMRMALSQ